MVSGIFFNNNVCRCRQSHRENAKESSRPSTTYTLKVSGITTLAKRGILITTWLPRLERCSHYKNSKVIIFEICTRFWYRISLLWGAGLGQWWEHSPSTIVARDQFPGSTPYVGWACWFSTLLREVFPPVFRFSFLLKNQGLICSDFSWFVVSLISRALVLG